MQWISSAAKQDGRPLISYYYDEQRQRCETKLIENFVACEVECINLLWWYDLTLSFGLLSRHMFRWLVEADGLGMDLAATMFFVITKGKDLSRSIRAS